MADEYPEIPPIPMRFVGGVDINSTRARPELTGAEMLLWSGTHGFHRGVWDAHQRAWRVMAHDGQAAFDEDNEPIFSRAQWAVPVRRIKMRKLTEASAA